ncbi:hypothetical protein [uncultured Gammaproteobacteria bacterium]|jgi:HD-like signal output (HDOD) protein|uniref:HDOD domain-containing protein n=1 Tax=methanotrophic endosymbiont of Bathymodiolus puteoserpentis (Logatchev) TaxID=343235 RepID=UPI0013C9503C|nr:HDOD domain-containing protein [methanotrophic endosymbiont of Bathymodiolus puteoserpentis (Logatchev)]CAC9633711.1 hypothetical protein [uncultured Gammaproteobacteria bacterium]SHE21790.1 hypothetical protein BPUTEOMOX_543 [methanotrophic endosymbiont of Bathymodiolus puteoserpentis (Logatchev)]
MEPSLIDWTFQCIDSKNAPINPPADLRTAVSQIKQLPPLPGIATRIMKLAADPLADANKLAAIVELDPLLTTQVIRWASSPLYGYKGKITSVHDAISRVLGYQFVFDLVLGLSALSPLKAPIEGIIGTRAFWTHALASSHLMSDLNKKQPVEDRFATQTVFFVALMHNIGLPLLADQFPKEFKILSHLADTNPTLNLYSLEKFALGVDHTELGSWLLKSWDMPPEVVEVVYHHHNPHYRGSHYQLNLLTYLSDSLLTRLNIGENHETNNIDQVIQELQINPVDCDNALTKLQNELDNIKAMVGICLNS